MKFKLALTRVARDGVDNDTRIEALRRLGFAIDLDDGRGDPQEQLSAQPEIEILDLDMLVQFTREWGPVTVEADTLTLGDV